MGKIVVVRFFFVGYISTPRPSEVLEKNVLYSA